MKSNLWMSFAMFVCIFTTSFAQVSNLIINGSSGNFTFTSGDEISWSYNVATGATVNGEFWYDVNHNGTLEPATDVARFIFTQTDGDTTGSGGPPDMDGFVDGHIEFMQPVGLAPGNYIGKFSHNASSVVRAGTVLALASPAHLISGNVTPPVGESKQYILIEIQRNENAGQPNFWDAFTDSAGNYTIQMNGDTAGNPWRIRIENNPYPPAIITPQEIEVVITGNHSGNDFVFAAAGAQVTGYVYDENDQPLADVGAQIQQDSTYVNFNGRTNSSGFFQIGIPPGNLGPNTWKLYTQSQGNATTTQLEATSKLPSIGLGDSLFRILKIYNVNSQITGTVRLNGNPPNFPIQLLAINSDSGQANTWADSTNGNFSMPVSDKIQNYIFELAGSPFGWMVEPIVAHPGDSGVVVNIVSQTNVLINWANGWNMLSVPVRVSDNQKSSLFPQATSPAYDYSAGIGYQVQSNLFNGRGYWMKFNGSNSTSLNGTYIARETIAVATGWNLLGGISSTISAGTVTSAPDSIIVSPFYQYTITGYQPVASLDPGKGFWVKVNQGGLLLLNTTATAPAAVRNERLFTNELPPPPPSEAGYGQQLPGEFGLGQNFPNPFNPTTFIEYDLPEASHVKITLYNTLGEEVYVLVDGEKEAGTHSAEFHALHLASGMYVYTFTAVGSSSGSRQRFSSARKMILIK